MIIVVMGVSGTGKTTVGKALASELEIPFYDADDFHPQGCLLYTSPSPRDATLSRMPSSA